MRQLDLRHLKQQHARTAAGSEEGSNAKPVEAEGQTLRVVQSGDAGATAVSGGESKTSAGAPQKLPVSRMMTRSVTRAHRKEPSEDTSAAKQSTTAARTTKAKKRLSRRTNKEASRESAEPQGEGDNKSVAEAHASSVAHKSPIGDGIAVSTEPATQEPASGGRGTGKGRGKRKGGEPNGPSVSFLFRDEDETSDLTTPVSSQDTDLNNKGEGSNLLRRSQRLKSKQKIEAEKKEALPAAEHLEEGSEGQNSPGGQGWMWERGRRKPGKSRRSTPSEPKDLSGGDEATVAGTHNFNCKSCGGDA